ncbi:hypothetical protein F1Z66_11555 [Candidatus Nitrosocosmicus sp. SS]|nr:hypothetical protein F1Z66_11555 [Candidatus Nitrosocosmicus sp. SS]
MFNFLKKHKCEYCKKKFRKIEYLMHHTLLNHPDSSTYDCSNCGEKFSDMDKLKAHVKKMHFYKKKLQEKG